MCMHHSTTQIWVTDYSSIRLKRNWKVSSNEWNGLLSVWPSRRHHHIYIIAFAAALLVIQLSLDLDTSLLFVNIASICAKLAYRKARYNS